MRQALQWAQSLSTIGGQLCIENRRLMQLWSMPQKSPMLSQAALNSSSLLLEAMFTC